MSNTPNTRLDHDLDAANVSVDGTYNFRDLGGRKTVDNRSVATGRAFRSASLATITNQGIETLESLGVRTVVDLRSLDEVDRHGRFPFEQGSARWVHVASTVGPPVGTTAANDPRREFLDHPDPMSLVYQRVVTEGTGMLTKAIRLVADPANHPIVFHCTSGKDRTGILAFLISVVVGVPIDEALADFEYSNKAFDAIRSHMESHYPEMAAMPAETLTRMASTDRAWLLDALNGVHALPVPDQWLDQIGVTEEVRQSLRRGLIS